MCLERAQGTAARRSWELGVRPLARLHRRRVNRHAAGRAGRSDHFQRNVVELRPDLRHRLALHARLPLQRHLSNTDQIICDHGVEGTGRGLVLCEPAHIRPFAFNSVFKFFQADITGVVRMTSCARYFKEGWVRVALGWRWIMCFFERRRQHLVQRLRETLFELPQDCRTIRGR